MRTVKLVLPPDTSYQATSCLINDSKYLIRIRVTCRMAVRFAKSTQNIPNINCHNVAINESIPYAMESFIISTRFSSIVAFVLYKIYESIIENINKTTDIKNVIETHTILFLHQTIVTLTSAN